MNAVLYSLFPVAAALVAAACAVFFQRSDRIRCLMQHLAAGVVVAAVTVELVPGVDAQTLPSSNDIGILSGSRGPCSHQANGRPHG